MKTALRRLGAMLTTRSPSSLSPRLRRLRLAIFLTLLAVVISAAMSLAVHRIGFLLRTEFFVEDVERTIYSPVEPQQKDIVIVAIDDSTLDGFPYTSPIDRGFLDDLVKWVAAQSPRAIGIDILFDQPTEAAKDEALRRTLLSIKAPLVVSYVNDPNIETPERQEYLDRFIPPRMRGIANLAADPFDTARYILTGSKGTDGKEILSFPRRLADHLGKPLPPGLVEIAWRGSPDAETDPFRIYPAQIVRVLDPAFFRNKVVLIGSSFSITDRHRTPFAAVHEGPRGSLPGVVIQAHALAQLLEERPQDRPHPLVNFAITCLLALMGALTGRVERAFVYTATIGFVIIGLFWINAFVIFHNFRIMIELLPPSLALMAASWITESLSGQEARRQREFIRQSFAEYVPPTVVRELLLTPERQSLRGQRREITMMFTDVTEFTSLSEGLEAQQLGLLINDYLDGLCQVLFDFDGTMLKFMGDGTFAIFNAPTDQSDHAERAVRCALRIDTFAQGFKAQQAGRASGFGITRIGLHTGEAAVGTYGSLARKEYGAMGDAVNTASRLESLNKYFGTRMIVSAATVERCSTIAFRPLGEVILKGKSIPTPIFEPLEMAALPAEGVNDYALAYRAMKTGDPAALALFEALLVRFPEDSPIRMHAGRLRAGETGAVITMAEK